MAETSTFSVISRTQSDVAAMKETLNAQQQLLQKLCIELDKEREASASAASEAMDTIMRVQGEKAAVKMEASHYKRIAEEKIGHADATLEYFEELMYKKEMEIASLVFQVQAYKHKLLSLGCDLNASEFEFSDDLLLNGSDQQIGEKCTVRRQNSLPPLPFKNSLLAARNDERSTSLVSVPVSDVISRVVEESIYQEISPSSPSLDLTQNSVEFTNETFDSYMEQIKKLDEKVKVISDCTGGEKSASLSNTRGRSCSIFSQANTKIPCYQIDRLPCINSDEVIHGEGTEDRKEAINPPCVPKVHDVFEVSHASEKYKHGEHGRERLGKWHSEAENRLTKPDSLSEGTAASHVKHDAEKRKGILRVHTEIKIPSPNDMMTVAGHKKHRMCAESDAQAEFQKLRQRIELLEKERIRRRQEIIHERDGQGQLRLLRDIQSQLTLIQSEMRVWKTKKSTPMDDVPLGPLQEAMLHFWL